MGWLLLSLRRASLRINNAMPVDHRRERTRATASTAAEHVAPTGIAKQIGLAHLPFPKQVASEALTELCREHLPSRRAWCRRRCGRGQVPWVVERDRRSSDGWQYRSRQSRRLSLNLVVGRSSAGRVGKRSQALLGQASRDLNGIVRVIRTVALILQLLPLGTTLGTVAAMRRGRGRHHGSLGGDLSSQGHCSR